MAYWSATRSPLASLAFVTPLLIVYEVGLLWFGPQAMRNGADVWLRRLLETLGFGQYFLLPVITCAVLLGWHHINRDSWKFRGTVLYGMLLESCGFGALLLCVAQLHQGLLAIESAAETNPVPAAISYLGAGIYEELLFRLLLLSGLMAALRRTGTTRLTELCIAIALSSAVFAAAHHHVHLPGFSLNPLGEPWIWSRFAFRFIAGGIFSLLFLSRGFGVAVGTHALYDILVGC